jgi:predicted secreted protein
VKEDIMASAAIPAYGTLLKRETAPASGVFANVAEVKSMSGPTMKGDIIDVTTHSSAAAGAWREKISSLLDPGDISFAINLVPASSGHKAILADFTGRIKTNYKFVFPDAGLTEWAFTGYMTQFNAKAETDNVLEADVTVTLTGAPTFPA